VLVHFLREKRERGAQANDDDTATKRDRATVSKVDNVIRLLVYLAVKLNPVGGEGGGSVSLIK